MKEAPRELHVLEEPGSLDARRVNRDESGGIGDAIYRDSGLEVGTGVARTMEKNEQRSRLALVV